MHLAALVDDLGRPRRQRLVLGERRPQPVLERRQLGPGALGAVPPGADLGLDEAQPPVAVGGGADHDVVGAAGLDQPCPALCHLGPKAVDLAARAGQVRKLGQGGARRLQSIACLGEVGIGLRRRFVQGGAPGTRGRGLL